MYVNAWKEKWKTRKTYLLIKKKASRFKRDAFFLYVC